MHIVDFVSFEKKLVIELDGGQYNDEKVMEKDSGRTKWLEREGFEY